MKVPTVRRAGFTLVELLVVIGIIAILISVLLPSLASARRQANTVKCMASLKEIGNAFKMYAIDFKGVWPVASWRNPSGNYWSAWTDALNKYVKKNATYTNRGDIGKDRGKSILWGCPEYRLATEYNAAAGASSTDFNYTGYGMNYLPPSYLASGKLTDQSIYTASVNGTCKKYTEWCRNGADRLLVADAVVEFIQTPSAFSRASIEIPPYDAMSPWTGNQFYVDSNRHAKPGIKRKDIFKVKAVNILFCDGHVSTGTVQDAWNAIRNPGHDKTTP